MLYPAFSFNNLTIQQYNNYLFFPSVGSRVRNYLVRQLADSTYGLKDLSSIPERASLCNKELTVVDPAGERVDHKAKRFKGGDPQKGGVAFFSQNHRDWQLFVLEADNG